MNFMVNTKQKPILDLHTKKRKNTDIILETIIKSQEKRGRVKKDTKKYYKTNQKKINKMARSTHLSINTLNINGLNGPFK